MSYPMDLDDYDDEDLINELARRCAERSKGNCDACRRPRSEPAKCGSGRHGRDEKQLRAYLIKMGVVEKS